jgi:hypothetical protein
MAIEFNDRRKSSGSIDKAYTKSMKRANQSRVARGKTPLKTYDAKSQRPSTKGIFDDSPFTTDVNFYN